MNAEQLRPKIVTGLDRALSRPMFFSTESRHIMQAQLAFLSEQTPVRDAYLEAVASKVVTTTAFAKEVGWDLTRLPALLEDLRVLAGDIPDVLKFVEDLTALFNNKSADEGIHLPVMSATDLDALKQHCKDYCGCSDDNLTAVEAKEVDLKLPPGTLLNLLVKFLPVLLMLLGL